MSRRDPFVRLDHMRDYARQAIQMATGRTRKELDTNDMLRLALTHLVELVGEAASQFPEENRRAFPQIPWLKVVSMRHRLIHGYFKVDLDLVWKTVQRDLSTLLNALASPDRSPEL